MTTDVSNRAYLSKNPAAGTLRVAIMCAASFAMGSLAGGVATAQISSEDAQATESIGSSARGKARMAATSIDLSDTYASMLGTSLRAHARTANLPMRPLPVPTPPSPMGKMSRGTR